MNPPHPHKPKPKPKPMPINLKSLRTRFALRFLASLRKITHTHQAENQNLITSTHQRPSNDTHNNELMVAQRPRFLRVKLAAEASMASAVGPHRAWTRAVLQRTQHYRRSSCHSHHVVRRSTRLCRPRTELSRAWDLRRLVPGGEAMDLQSLLDETAHYIKCLSTQVMVMRCILNYCSN